MKKSTTVLLSLILLFISVSTASAYTVKQGDSTYKIAQAHNMSLSHLMSLNPQISNFNLIYPGQHINTESTSGYIVKSGDSLWIIANKHGVSISELLRANPSISNANLIYVGQSITIPAKSSVPSKPVEITEAKQDFVSQVINLTNQERAKHGLQPLKENRELSRVARFKSEDMRDNNYFAHNSPVYGSPFRMMSDFGINYRSAAENIAVGQSTPQQVVESWMNSQGHRANILNTNFTEIGVGYAQGGQWGHYWTQQFMTR